LYDFINDIDFRERYDLYPTGSKSDYCSYCNVSA
jgi:hypothetical protein